VTTKRFKATVICGAAFCVFLAVWGVSPAVAAVVDSYCSPSGDYCTSVEQNQRATSRVKFRITTFSFRGHYRVCVRHPGGRKHCRRRHLAEHRSYYRDKVDFALNFPHAYSGRYTVSWRKFGHRLGRRLHFNFG
jgi:hypothetical protein